MPTQPQTTPLHQRQAFDAGQTFMLEVDQEWIVIAPSNDDDPRSPLDLSWLDPNVPSVLCRSCPRILPVTCFQGGWNSQVDQPAKSSRHPDCVICEFRTAEAHRKEHCWEIAAEQRLRDHSRKERGQGLHQCRTFEEYQRLTGVTVAWLAAHMKMTWELNLLCHHCETAGKPAHWQTLVPDPVHDLSRMTLDRTDPSRLLARDNLSIMCLGGNIAKHKTDPRLYNIRQAYWRFHNHALGGDTPTGG